MSRTALEQLYIARLSRLDLLIRSFPRLKYALDNHKNNRGERMVFHDRPYLLGLFQDNAAEIDMMSCVQMGKSEMLMVSAFHYAEMGMLCMYVLPDIETRNQFVAARIDPVIGKVPHYRSMIQHDSSERTSDSRGLKHFGRGTIFFAGSNSATTFVEKPLDVILADELDLFDLENYEKADDRLSASKHKIKYQAANPRVEGFGISKSYEGSDQRRWMLRCDRCEQWQEMEWFENVVMQIGDKSGDYRLRDAEWYDGCGRDIQVFCRHCNRPIDRLQPGEWVAKHPGRERHGYQLSQLFGAHNAVAKMFSRFLKGTMDETAMQVFFNSVLGLPYAGAGSKLTDGVLNDCKQPYLMPAKAGPCVMGVDVGKRLHVVIRQICPDEKLRLVFAGTVGEFDDLDILMARFEVVSFAIDSMPETRKAMEFVRKHPHKGWIVRYQEKLVEITKDEEARVITADRTQLMDKVHSFFQRRAFINPMNAERIDRGDYYKMLKMPTRIFLQEKVRFTWLGDPDHYFHAENYALLAYVARGEFKVFGLSTAAPAFAAAPKSMEAFEKATFPPGTDPQIVEHYRRLYEQMKTPAPSDTMRGELQGTTTDG